MDTEKAVEFVKENHRAILLTRRADGGPQMSPVVTAPDDEGRVLISTRETAYKSKNLARDPRCSLCAFTDGFFGPWIQVDGTAELVHLPEAMDLLVDYYKRLAGEHDDWDEYRSAMEKEQRLIVRITIEHVGPDRSG